MTGVIAVIPKYQFSSALGIPLSNGILETYVAGSTSPAPTYQDKALTIANTNPIDLDSRGECVLWLAHDKAYKFVLKNSLGVTQWTVDNVTGADAEAHLLRDDLAGAAGASMIGYSLPTGGSITVEAKLRESVSVKDYGASATKSKADNRAALQAAIRAVNAAGGGTVVVPGDIDYGFVTPAASSYPDFTACVTDIAVIDHGPGDADVIGNKCGAQTRAFYHTAQTTPVGQHDGNGHWINGNWHPYLSVNNTAVYASPGAPGRTASDNRRASIIFCVNGKTNWRVGQGTLVGAGYTDEEMSNWVMEHYQQDSDTLATYAPWTIERKTGNWSIGESTNGPPASLHVRSRVSGYPQGMFESKNTTSTLVLRNSNGETDDINLRSLAGDYVLNFGSVGNAMYVNKANRRVGFGVDTPSFKLEVAENRPSNYVAQISNLSGTDGSVQKLISASLSGPGWAFLNCYASNGSDNRLIILGNGNVQNSNNSYGAMSDVKLKENIADSTPKLADLLRVRIVNYNLKSDPDHKQLGVIAQELEQIFPNMVEETPDLKVIDGELVATGTSTKFVKYSVFVPMLIKAIQEQQVLLTDALERIAGLESQLENS